MMLEAMGTTPEDYDYAVFHQPNGKFPTRVAGQLGFTNEQIAQGLLTPEIGNTYSGAVPLGLASVLDVAKPGDRIFITSYGSGAGSDAFDITVTENIKSYKREKAATVAETIADTVQLDYAKYAMYKEKIVLPE